MSKKSAKLIPALWPLPGGNSRYLNTLDQILKWASNTPETTRDKFSTWMATQYNASKSAGGYLQVVLKLGVLESHSDGKLTLTPLGKKILEAEDEAKAKIVIDRFMRDYLAFPEVLAVYAQANSPIHLKEMVEALKPQFPQWTSEAQFEYRALWLLSLGCLHQAKGRYYEITDLGKAVAMQFPPSIEIRAGPPIEPGQGKKGPPQLPSMPNEETQLIAELEAAATDSQAPDRLERAVARSFEYLGFAVDQLGGSGETDVLVWANIGPESYTVVVDAKARSSGKLQNLEVYTLKDHLHKNEADYAVVVAGSFAGGKVINHAKDNQVVLLSVPVIGAWLQLHAHTPLNLSEYRAMFTTPGLVDGLPAVIKSAAEKQQQWSHLLVDLIELIQETYEHGLTQPLPTNQLFAMLVTRLRGVRYAEQEVQEAIALLVHPAFKAALGTVETGIALAMNRHTLAQTFRALADQIETAEAETQE
jgi:predicted transcriptional regulator